MSSEPTAWTFRRVLDSLRKFWLGIVALTLVGGGMGLGLSVLQTPMYDSTASLYFALSSGNSAVDLNQGSTYTQNQMLSFAQLATSSRVLEPVIEELGLDLTPRQLARSLTIEIPLQTVILEVTSTDASAKQAARIANSVARSLVDVVQAVAPESSAGSASITAKIIDKAVRPEVQSSPNKTKNAGLGALLGLLVGVLTAMVVSLADTKVRNAEVAASVTDVPVLGQITRMPTREGAALVVARQPLSHGAEEYRQIRSALAFANVDGRASTLLVTSAGPGEGKSTFAANMSLALAETRERVLVIDADLRRPRVAPYFGVEGAVGLTGVLLGEVDLADAISTRADSTLDILTAGVVAPNPSEILASAAMRNLIAQAEELYDLVVIDSPPVLSVADANLLAPLVSGVLLIADATKTSRAQLAAAVDGLRVAGAHVLGVVLNRVRPPRRRDDYYVDGE